MQMFYVSLLCKQSIKLTTSPYFSIIHVNVYLVDINVFAKFDEIPSLPVQDIEKIKRCKWTNGTYVETVYPNKNSVCHGATNKL